MPALVITIDTFDFFLAEGLGAVDSTAQMPFGGKPFKSHSGFRPPSPDLSGHFRVALAPFRPFGGGYYLAQAFSTLRFLMFKFPVIFHDLNCLVGLQLFRFPGG